MITTINYPEDNGKTFEMFRYPAGEVQVRLINEIPHENEVHVFARIKDGEIMGLAQLVDAIRWRYQTYLFLPYMPYSRADRRFTAGDCNGIGTFTQMLHALRCYKIVTLDVHSDKAKNNLPELINISPKPFILDVMHRLESSVQVLLPDQGAARYGISAAFCEKKRDPVTGKLSGFEVPPREVFKDARGILVVDDICDGGGTFVGIGEKLKNYGLPLYLYVTHGIMSKGCTQLLKYYKHIFTTDSFYNLNYEDVTVLPCKDLLIEKRNS